MRSGRLDESKPERTSGGERRRLEIARALGRKVWLKSGGYIIIEQTEALTAAAGKIAEKAYAEQAAQAGGEGQPGAEQTDNAAADDVVDAEFEEVDKDDESKSA